MAKQMTAPDVKALKGVRKISMLTAYDHLMAQLVDRCELDMILVGDSLGMVMLGREDTVSVTLDEMAHHTAAVARAAGHALVVADMPFMSYEPGVQTALASAGRLFKEAGARAVKLEGAGHLEQVRALVAAGIPVQGHIGLTPQRIAELGGFKVQGKSDSATRLLLEEAQALVNAGVFSLVLEAMPAELAAQITETVAVPTIGIGAGPHCDGQVLVLHDMLGLYDRLAPKFVKRYANLAGEVETAVRAYKAEVESGAFPDETHSFSR